MSALLSPDVLVPVLGIAWVAYTAFFVAARRGGEPMVRRWAEREGIRVLRMRPQRVSIFNTEQMLKVSMVQRVFEVIGTHKGRHYLWTVRVGHGWLGSFREEAMVMSAEPWDGVLEAGSRR